MISSSTSTTSSQTELVGSLFFQIGLVALLAVMWDARATWLGRAARAVLVAEFAAVVLAIVWTVPYMYDPDRTATIPLRVLDVFWPLSMLGTLVVGVMVARAGRWPAPWRYLPLSAGLLLVVEISIIWAPEAVRSTVAASYILLSHAVVGLSVVAGAPCLATLSRVRPIDAHVVPAG